VSEIKTKDDIAPREDWQADWEGHRQWQMTSALETTPAQRLAWLEEMLELMRRIGARSGSD
jgi:hypothetical protein